MKVLHPIKEAPKEFFDWVWDTGMSFARYLIYKETYFSSESLLNRTNRISQWSGITTILSNAEALTTAECHRR